MGASVKADGRRMRVARSHRRLESTRDSLLAKRELIRTLAAAHGPRSVPLFGSAARGDGDTASDIDILVIRPRDVDEEDERCLL